MTTRKQTAILCRTNAPLISCAFDLLRRNVRIKIIGKDVAKQLKDTIGEVLDYRRRCPTDEFLILLDGWITKLRDKYGQDDRKQDLLAEKEDHYGSLKAIAENNCMDSDTDCLLKTIDTYFVDEGAADDPDSVILCSGHRAKGLEWKRVIILRPDLLPHPAAETEADLQQEEHLKYVMFTRAEEDMLICHDQTP